MQKLLIVSPNFPPTNAPDHQRVRVAIPHFEHLGWKPTVLAVRADEVEAPVDPLLLKSIPPNLRRVDVQPWPLAWTRKLGFGGLSTRALGAIRRAGNKLLSTEGFDLVYFSTTQFRINSLGTYWKRRFGVPYVVDLQDPWLNDYYADHPGQRPPGGRIKFWLSTQFARYEEPRCLRNASHITAVSADYASMLSKRYSWFDTRKCTTLPFAGSAADFEILRENSASVKQNQFETDDNHQHWVYVGRGGADMRFALASFFSAFAQAKSCDSNLSNVRMHFIGTSYARADAAQPTVQPVAEEFGLQGVVHEHPQRIPYFEALRCMLDADALIVPGSDDSSYTASKIYPYILVQKPLLSIFHANSSIHKVLQETAAGQCVAFDSQDTVEDVASRVHAEWFSREQYRNQPQTNWDAYRPYSSERMADKLVEIFDQAVVQLKNTENVQRILHEYDDS